MARFAHKNNIRVFYYISPQIWAWKQSRWKQVKAYVDKMYVILPFEKEFYQKFGIETDFVGHPLIDAVESYHHGRNADEHFRDHYDLDDRPIVALLPGSRKQEIGKMLPVMLKMPALFPEYQFVIAGAPSQDESFYQTFLQQGQQKIVFGATYKLLAESEAALVTSGTATLETAIFKVPQVVCYKGGFLSYYIARSLVKVKYISLVNLIMDREVVTELIQADFNESRLKTELQKILNRGADRLKQLEDYEELYEKLGGGGASEKTARLMLKTLRESA
jgi:lipid-A-disaccharide synthase